MNSWLVQWGRRDTDSVAMYYRSREQMGLNFWKNMTSTACWTCGRCLETRRQSQKLRHQSPLGKRSNTSSPIFHMLSSMLLQVLRLVLNDCHRLLKQYLPACACPVREHSFLGAGVVRRTDWWSLRATVSVLESAMEKCLEEFSSTSNNIDLRMFECWRFSCCVAHHTCGCVRVQCINARRKLLAATKIGVLLFHMLEHVNQVGGWPSCVHDRRSWSTGQ